MKIFIDGIEFTSNTAGLDSGTITFRDLNSENEQALDYSSSLTFTGAAFKYLKDKLVCPVDGYAKYCEVQIYDECCDYGFDSIIRGADIEYCEVGEECTIKVGTVEDSEDARKRLCFQNTLVYDGISTKYNITPTNFHERTDHPQIQYCNDIDPNWLHGVLMAVGLFVWLFINIALLPFIAIFNFIPIPNPISNSVNSAFNNVKNFILEFAIGCGRVHPTPLLRDYIKNACEICGLQFKSSILNDPSSIYYNTLYFNAPSQKGILFGSGPYKRIEANKPSKTGTELLDEVKCIHNAEWKIKDGCLFYERKDLIEVLGGLLIDVSILSGNEEIKLLELCYKSVDIQCAYGKFEYSQDAIDTSGNKALGLYNDNVEWNPGGDNPALKGGCEHTCNFGAARFRADGLDSDIIDSNFVTSSISPYGSIASQYENVLFLSKGTAQLPKLLIWDGASLTDSKIINQPTCSSWRDDDVRPGALDYNWPYYFEAGYGCGSELYQNFHFMEDPRYTDKKRRPYTLKLKYNCELLANMDPCKTVQLPFCGNTREGDIASIIWQPKSKTLTIQGKI